MRKFKEIFLTVLISMSIVSCGDTDAIVQIYGAYEYNCTTDEYRVLSENVILPFMKKKSGIPKKNFMKHMLNMH